MESVLRKNETIYSYQADNECEYGDIEGESEMFMWEKKYNR